MHPGHRRRIQCQLFVNDAPKTEFYLRLSLSQFTSTSGSHLLKSLVFAYDPRTGFLLSRLAAVFSAWAFRHMVRINAEYHHIHTGYADYCEDISSSAYV